MDKHIETAGNKYQILTLILSDSRCHKCIHIAKGKGLFGGIATIGRGTVSSSVLNALGIKSQKREIISFLLEKDKSEEILDCFTTELQLHEPGHGIAFTSPVILADRRVDEVQNNDDKAMMEERDMFKKLTVIVDRGMGQDVMDIARKAGVRGGTIMHGRGVGAEYTEKLFGVEIEPEKELVLILIPDDLVSKVVNALYEELQLEEAGKGILFVEPVDEVRGLFQPSHHDNDK
ncbi:MAG: P-II family nitrogen regulator [Clostridiaceae bacterium]|nr:P-II family nitrogen regulator [Clostridiaceae bacterium]